MSIRRLNAMSRLLTRKMRTLAKPTYGPFHGVPAPPRERPVALGFSGLAAIPAHFGPAGVAQAWAGVNAAGYFGGGPRSLASPPLLPRNARMASRPAWASAYSGSTLMASS